MFSSLFFLIVTVLLINLAPEIRQKLWITDPVEGLIFGIVFYLITLGIIYAQNKIFHRRRNRSRWLIIANIELILFFILYYFVFGTDRIFGNWESPDSILALALYFGGLAFFHYTYSKEHKLLKKTETFRQIKILIPFTIPFVTVVFLLDGLKFAPGPVSETYLFVASLVVIFTMLMFLPTLICQTWGCTEMHDCETRSRLEGICKNAGFKHGGLKEWTVMNNSPTAAIIGILPRFRYILFSRYLLHALPTNAVDAILAHEIGHSQRKHLLMYPLIILGMMVATAWAGMGFDWLLKDWHHPYYKPIVLFFLYVLVLGIYFRLVFGFFSRQFERQADLHVVKLGLPLDDMIVALDEVGVNSGNTHYVPSWHHFSIAERIDFLKACIANPALIENHHRNVRIWVTLYLIVLALAFGALFYYP